MKDTFFEGKDFKGSEFKALITKYYPVKYQNYISEETKILENKIKGASKVLEAGVGIGRLIPKLAPLVEELVGVDNADLMIVQSNKISKSFPNVFIKKSNLEEISKIFGKGYFDYSLCLWNTLGNVADEVKVLKELSIVTSKSIFVTVYLKGTVKDRENWYKTLGVNIKKIDEANEIFYSESGLRSKSYSLEDMQKIAERTGLRIKENRILAGVILWVDLVKK